MAELVAMLRERSMVINSYMRNTAMNPLFKDVSALELREMIHKTYPTIFTQETYARHFEVTLIEAHIVLADKSRKVISAQREQNAAEVAIFEVLNSYT